MSLSAILGGIIAAIVAVAGAWFAGMRGGKRKAADKAARRENETYRKATEAQNEVARLPDDAVTDRLRDRSKR